jgi:hypothetical protein
MMTTDTALVENLVQISAEHIGVRAELVLSGSREANVALARQAVMYALRERGWLLDDIGAVTNRDHSTVHHGIRKVALRQRVDPDIRRLCLMLTGHEQSVDDGISSALAEVTSACLALLTTVGRLQHELDNERAIRDRAQSNTRRTVTA